MSAAARPAGDVDRARFDSAMAAASTSREHQAAREVGESDNEVADRDADGREPWRAPERPALDADEEPRPVEAGPGHRLDCVV